MAHYKKPRNDYDFFKFLGNIAALQEEKDRQQDKGLEDAATLLGTRAGQHIFNQMWAHHSATDREETLKDLERRRLLEMLIPEGAD